jgi:predicted P-loop ATPase
MSKELELARAIAKIEAAYSEEDGINTDGMSRNKEGQIPPNYSNIVKAIAQLNIKYDVFIETPLIDLYGSTERFKDNHYVEIVLLLERSGFKTPSMSVIKDIIRKVFADNSYDSAIDWANSLEWDGQERVPTLLSKYFGVVESPYESACSMYLATAMAGRLLDPGCQADMVPVLIGGQGVGKTSAVMALAPLNDSYTEIDLSNTRDEDMGRQLRGKLICELGELKGLKSRDSEWIKSWITRRKEEWIPKYVEYSTIMPRRCVFIGTSNESQFLTDSTGNRRWLPLDVECECDVKLLKEDINQIWAESIVYYRTMGVAWFAAQDLAKDRHGDHVVVDDVMLDRVTEYLNSSQYSTEKNHRIKNICSFIGLGDNPSRVDQLRVGDAMRNKGYKVKKMRYEGSNIRVWVKEEAEQ